MVKHLYKAIQCGRFGPDLVAAEAMVRVKSADGVLHDVRWLRGKIGQPGIEGNYVFEVQNLPPGELVVEHAPDAIVSVARLN